MATVYQHPYNSCDLNIPQIKILEWIKPSSRILELGCASGRVSQLLTERLRCSVVGVENDAALSQLAKGVCARVIQGNIETQEIWKQLRGGYDYVLFLDVIEHLKDPCQVLRMCVEQCFSSETRLIVAVPNALVWHTRKEFLFGRFEYRSSGTLDRTHLRFFTLRSATKMLEESGFEITKLAITWYFPVLSGLYSNWMRLANPKAVEKLREQLCLPSSFVSLLEEFSPAKHAVWVRRCNRMLGIPVRLCPGLFGNHFLFMARPLWTNQR